MHVHTRAMHKLCNAYVMHMHTFLCFQPIERGKKRKTPVHLGPYIHKTSRTAKECNDTVSKL